MFRIKICGVTLPHQVASIRAAGADAIGLNFYTHSRRFVSRETARQVAAAAAGEMIKVGVFVNSAADTILDTFDDLALDLIQLHGDEPPEFIRELGGRPVMKAFRVGADGITPVVKFLDACRVLNVLPSMILLDADVPGEYGGSGAVADWNQIAAARSMLGELPMILAGGLTTMNVESAIRAVHPSGVDTASGVESSPGIKDGTKLKSFCAAAQRAFS